MAAVVPAVAIDAVAAAANDKAAWAGGDAASGTSVD